MRPLIAVLALGLGCRTEAPACWDVDADGLQDAQEDLNGDGLWSEADCLPIAGAAGPPGAPGISCWDLDGDGVADPEEDLDGSGTVDVSDCVRVGPPGRACWDRDGDGVADLAEDINGNGIVDAYDCLGPPGPEGPEGPEGPPGPSGAGGDGIHTLDEDHTGFEMGPGDRLRIQGTVVVRPDDRRFRAEGLTMHGGKLDGEGQGSAYLGWMSVVTGVEFEDVELGGGMVTFISCIFRGEIDFPAGSVIIGSQFADVVAGNSTIGAIQGSSMTNVEGLSAETISDSSLYRSVVEVESLTGSRVSRGEVYVDHGGRVIGNVFDNATVLVEADRFSSVQITGNTFVGAAEGRAMQLRVDAGTGQAGIVTVASNSFRGRDSVLAAIQVTGVATGSYQAFHADGNTFVDTGLAFSYDSTVPGVVRGSMLLDTLPGTFSEAARLVGNTQF